MSINFYMKYNNILLEDENRMDLSGYSYPQEVQDLDKKVEELKAQLKDIQTQLDAAIRVRNKAKSDFTKTIPSLKDQDKEFAGINFSGYSKQKQYSFKQLVDNIKQISEKSGNDWETLTKALKSQFGDRLIIRNIPELGPTLYFPALFAIETGQSSNVKKHLSYYIKIGDWYVRPW